MSRKSEQIKVAHLSDINTKYYYKLEVGKIILNNEIGEVFDS